MDTEEKDKKKKKDTSKPTGERKYEKGMFSLKARARDKHGNLIWNS